MDASGSEDPRGLSVRGWQRAGALVGLLAASPEPRSSWLGRPGLILAAAPTGEHPSNRPEWTVLPLARRTGLDVELFRPDDYAGVWKRVEDDGGTVLVCWRHDFLSSLARASGADHVPRQWPADRYDVCWLLSRREGSRWTFTQRAQLLLPGDREEPIS